jgi:hypothetical protein
MKKYILDEVSIENLLYLLREFETTLSMSKENAKHQCKHEENYSRHKDPFRAYEFYIKMINDVKRAIDVLEKST